MQSGNQGGAAKPGEGESRRAAGLPLLAADRYSRSEDLDCNLVYHQASTNTSISWMPSALLPSSSKIRGLVVPLPTWW